LIAKGKTALCTTNYFAPQHAALVVKFLNKLQFGFEMRRSDETVLLTFRKGSNAAHFVSLFS